MDAVSNARVGIIAGGRTKGSNMEALVRRGPDFGYRVDVVVVPSSDAPALLRASALGVATKVVEPRDNYGPRLLEALGQVQVVCLAGFLRLLPDEVLHAFEGRILNIHPALLPKFGGKGMYGMHVHRAVLEAGEKATGCTVHLVTEVYDEGPVLLQRTCPVLADDTPETLAARVLELEHETYPQALALLLRGLA
jgi:phosphoribosylglycinamide formyltransferase 1